MKSSSLIWVDPGLNTTERQCLQHILQLRPGKEVATSHITSTWINASVSVTNPRPLPSLGMLSGQLVSSPSCLSSLWPSLCRFLSSLPGLERSEGEEKATSDSSSGILLAREERRRGERELDWKKVCWTEPAVADRNQLNVRRRLDLAASPAAEANLQAKVEMEVDRDHYDRCRYSLVVLLERAGAAPVQEDEKARMKRVASSISRSQIRKKTTINDSNWCKILFEDAPRILRPLFASFKHLTYWMFTVNNR